MRKEDGMEAFTHFNDQGRAQMVDISSKEKTFRTAIGFTKMKMNHDVWEKVIQKHMEKGDVLSVAQTAGIMAGKKTSELIPMCHPIMLTNINIFFEFPEPGSIEIYTKVKTTSGTGVEMEALTAASITALTIYDMCKALDKDMEIGPTYLLKKEGGKSGNYVRD